MHDKQEITQRALAFLGETATGVLATVSTAGQPYSSTIYFTFGDDFSIHFIVSHHSEKFKNLTMNPFASFTVGAGPAYREVSIRGSVQLVSESHARESVLAEIAKRVVAPMQEWPIFKVESLHNGGTALFTLTPTHVQYLDFELATGADEYKGYIYQLLP